MALTFIALVLMTILIIAQWTTLELLDARFDFVRRAGWLFTEHCGYPFRAEFRAPFADIIEALYTFFSFYVCMRIGQRTEWRAPRPMTK